MTGTHTPRVLCAVDYSAGSRTALRYAAAVARFLRARLTVLTVNDLLLVEAMHAAGYTDWPAREREDLRRFCREAVDDAGDIELDVRAGRPAEEILAAAARDHIDLIVMGCHGLTGMRKIFFGSTAERVLRDTTVPVLVTPTDLHAPHAGDIGAVVRRVLVPVDLSSTSASLARIGSRLAAVFGVPVMLVHVLEPLAVSRWRGTLPSLQAEARARADAEMARLAASAGGDVEPIVVAGEPSEEIGTVAHIRGAGLIVLGLQERGSGRVGVVAYRILSRAAVPILAIPAVSAARLSALLPDGAQNSAAPR